jgi:hypothetical protein
LHVLKDTKKVYLIPKSEKNNDTYGIYPTKFSSSTQQHKKVIETPYQPIEIKKISNKRMFSTSKVKRRQKFAWGTEFPGSTQNPKKVIRTPNLPIRTKFFQKKYVSYLKSVKEQKIRIGATRRNLQAQPKMLKKIVGTSNQPIKTKIFLRKLCFVP